MSEAVTVAGGTPTLTLNDGGTATYTSGSGTSALTFTYTVAAGQNVSALAATAVNLNSATIKDGAGNAASLSLTGLSQTGPQIDTTAPTVSSVTATAGNYNTGKTVTLTLNMSEAATVTGTPTLTLNDGGTATYVSGSGSNALVFSYTVLAGQNTAALQATAVSRDDHRPRRQCAELLQPAAELSPASSINTTAPVISAIAEIAIERRPRCRQDRHLHVDHERSGDGQHHRRLTDALAQRQWYRDLCQRLRYQRADLQLYRVGRAEHTRPRRYPRSTLTARPSKTAPAMPPAYRSPASLRPGRRSTPRHRLYHR